MTSSVERVLWVLVVMVSCALAAIADAPAAIFIEDEACRIEFDGATGGLTRIVNRGLNDECLKAGRSGTAPFRLYADLTREFEIGTNEKFQLVFDDPQSITRALVSPENCRLLDVQKDDGLTLRYGAEGLDVVLRVEPDGEPGVSNWALRVTNVGDEPREFLAGFPCFDGIRLGPDPAGNLATAMDQGGLVVPAWERPGGVLGESNQLSMQWHAVWDPATKSALGVLFMDAQALPKRLILSEPRLELSYFPPIGLAPGETYEFPRARVLVYEGDWRPAARAYRRWYDHAYPHLTPPEWFRHSDGLVGAHLYRGPRSTGTSTFGRYVIESFRELPGLQLTFPIDAWEYAFYCRSSMIENDQPFTPHTDGENIIREDLGGAKALGEGFAGVRARGHHATLYLDGYIMYGNCDLARSGAAQRWAVMRKDGSLTGPYSNQGFFHMCPGSVEWQDHLARTVARLLRETDADGVRVDSLGFYYLPCYNPAHAHATPFGYNEWLKQLLTKVRDAAVAVKPDVLLLTEGSADWLCPYVHGALTSRCPRELSPMRIAVGPFRPYVYASGTLWASLSGFAGAGCADADVHKPEWNWPCAQDPVHEALVWGDVENDPEVSDTEITARCFDGDGYRVVVAARSASSEPVWPRGTGLSDKHAPYVVTVRGCAESVADVVACDVESLTWTEVAVERAGADVRLPFESNWVLAVLRKPGGPRLADFDALSPNVPGGTSVVRTKWVAGDGGGDGRVRVTAPGLECGDPEFNVPGEALVRVPADALPGNYSVRLSGKGVLGVKRFLVVKQALPVEK